MTSRSFLASLACAAACTAVAVPAPATTRLRYLWATVNICDTARHPNMMGVRASMPGDGRRRTLMFMRFRAQYYDRERQLWLTVKQHGLSPWRNLGNGLYNRSSGWTFAFETPLAGSTYTLRGVVHMEWRRRVRVHGRLRTRVVRRKRVETRGGIKNPPGADPRGYSAARCKIT